MENQATYTGKDFETIYLVKEFETTDEIIYKLKKEVNKLTLEKAVLFGFLDTIIEELPIKKQEHYRDRIAKCKFVKMIGWTDEMPYVL